MPKSFLESDTFIFHFSTACRRKNSTAGDRQAYENIVIGRVGLGLITFIYC